MKQGGKILPVGPTGTRSYYKRATFDQSQPMIHNGSVGYKMLSADNPVEPYESTLFADFSAGAETTVQTYKVRTFTWVARIFHNFNRTPTFSVYEPGTGFQYSGLSAALTRYNNKVSNNSIDLKFPGTYNDTAQWVNATCAGGSTATETLTTTSTLDATNSAIAAAKIKEGSYIWVSTNTIGVMCKVNTAPDNYTATGKTLTLSKIFTSVANTTDTCTQTLGSANASVKIIPLDLVKYAFVTVA